MDEITAPWYSVDWFMASTWRGFTWENPVFLYLLAAVPFLFLTRWLVRYYFNQKLPVALIKSDVKTSPATWLRFVPETIFAIALILILVALARPQRTNEKVEQWSEGIDIMLAVDISQSMQIEDFIPNRLEAAKNVARDFIKGRIQDRIGIVVFSGDAFSLAPLTTDYDLLNAYLNDISFDMIESRGTAIGSAMAVVTNRMRESDSKSKVCILISDGDNTAGNIDPITAAELAAAYNIKIYTIIVGREGMVPFGKDYFGRPNMVENTIDETTMRKIAGIGSGRFFRVTDNEALKVVFEHINEYEKAEIKETRFKDTSDFYYIYLRWALIFFTTWIFLKSSFMANLLQD
ncbi:MAG TPA: VWA domain-containing protein [Cyclobacteriaceae bacterium]|jgi:Ca-activated chloride channel family protein|nr:VWA domain-containing protein [Cytophagales bacterium]HRE66717.1 VWA domain-containing protein [Cyclobacteriaceae bacterium]HRF33531.1 VWA domain-containing protein [Cyclobacteriaceae bacterium]